MTSKQDPRPQLARKAAERLLVSRHEDEFRTIYRAERIKVGLNPETSERLTMVRVAELEAEIERLRAELDAR